MSETILNAETGRRTGSSDSRRLRAEDRIPAVVYGHGMDPISISVNRRELRVALSGAAAMNTILDLTVDGKVYPSIIKDIQRHPVKRNVAARRLHPGEPQRGDHGVRAVHPRG